MPGKINQLPEILTNKIAAGEVVQRPSSVVKELVENSLDADSTRIEVIIKDGGRSLIQVSDNGEGIGPDDLEVAFQRYSTSKIATFEDLVRVQTLGFRGEALASIASVSMVELVSRRKGDETAHRIRLEGGKVIFIEPCAGEVGTSIYVQNLFFNTPARRKFLKGRTVEYRHVLDVIKRFSLLRPEIRFTFFHDGKEVYNLSSGTLMERIDRLFGTDYSRNLLAVDVIYRNYTLKGYVGNLNLVRTRPGEQYLFLNGRFITDRLINSAIFGAYHSLIQRGEYPFFVLSLGLPPEEVDVNVHPAKLEVKFRHEWEVFNFIKDAVQEVLGDIYHSLSGIKGSGSVSGFKPRVSPGKGVGGFQADFFATRPRPTSRPGHLPASEPPQDGLQMEEKDSTGVEALDEKIKRLQNSIKSGEEELLISRETEIWQIHNRYLISSIKNGIVIIDQHAAHERILYEKALKAMEERPQPGQQLLFPQIVEFSADDFSVLLEIIPYLNRIGFHFRQFGKRAVLVESVPSDMRWGNEGKAVREIIDHYLEFHDKESSILKSVAASYACKAAIKSGDHLTPEERRVLIDQLFATENPYFCPHGRPVILKMELSDLDKHFER